MVLFLVHVEVSHVRERPVADAAEKLFLVVDRLDVRAHSRRAGECFATDMTVRNDPYCLSAAAACIRHSGSCCFSALTSQTFCHGSPGSRGQGDVMLKPDGSCDRTLVSFHCHCQKYQITYS